MATTLATLVNDFTSSYSQVLEEFVEKGDGLNTLSNKAHDLLSELVSRLTQPKARAPRAPRAPRAARSASSAEQTAQDTAAASSTAAPVASEAAEPRARRSHVRRQERPNHLKKMNGYNLFVQHTMNNDPVISQKHVKSESGGEATGMSSKDKMKSCGVAWKALSDAEHDQWKQRSVGYNFYLQTTMAEPAAEGNTASFSERLTSVQSAWHGFSAADQTSWVERGVAEQTRLAELAAATAAPVVEATSSA